MSTAEPGDATSAHLAEPRQWRIDATRSAVIFPEVDALVPADHRQLGPTKNPLGMLRTPRELCVRARLIRDVAHPRPRVAGLLGPATLTPFPRWPPTGATATPC